MKEILIEEDANSNIKDYTSYVLTSRVLPRLDGLKPVQRRILWAMINMGCRTKYRKTAIVSGETMKYHPHGSANIDGAIATMVNSPNSLISGQGNWGSEEDPRCAASRYTEVKTSMVFEELFDSSCLNRDLGEYVPNFSEDEIEPYNLQFKVPLARLIGVNGIGIGFSTACPAITIKSLIDILNKYINNEDTSELTYEYAYGGVEYNNTIYPELHSTTIDNKKYLVINDIPLGSNKVFMNKSNYIRELVFSDQLEIRDESDITNIDNPIRILLSGPSEALKLIVNSMQKSIPDYLSYYDRRLRIRDYENSWIKFRKNYIAKRTYYEEADNLYNSCIKIALSNINSVIQNNRSNSSTFLELANSIGTNVYSEYSSKFKCEDSKIFMKSHDEFISSIMKKPVSSIKNYNVDNISDINQISDDELKNSIVSELDKIDTSIFSKPTRKVDRLPNIDNLFDQSVKRYIALRNMSTVEVSFKPISRLPNFVSTDNIYLVYEDCSTKLLDSKFFGTVENNEDKNIVGFMIPNKATIFVSVTDKISCFKRVSKIEELVKVAFPECEMIINGEPVLVKSGYINNSVTSYKISKTDI